MSDALRRAADATPATWKEIARVNRDRRIAADHRTAVKREGRRRECELREAFAQAHSFPTPLLDPGGKPTTTAERYRDRTPFTSDPISGCRRAPHDDPRWGEWADRYVAFGRLLYEDGSADQLAGLSVLPAEMGVDADARDYAIELLRLATAGDKDELTRALEAMHISPPDDIGKDRLLEPGGSKHPADVMSVCSVWDWLDCCFSALLRLRAGEPAVKAKPTETDAASTPAGGVLADDFRRLADEPPPPPAIAPTLTPTDVCILEALRQRHPTTMTLYELETSTNPPVTRRTAGPRVDYLIQQGLADRPHGQRKGVAITAKGLAILPPQAH